MSASSPRTQQAGLLSYVIGRPMAVRMSHLEKDLESVTDFETALRYEPTSQLHFREKCASLAILETITYNI
eukprot:7958397-Pyramimonas_sp.AAC.1